ncbi:MAG: hypothetical protein WAL80_08100 [Xanthobacteraceae bacterium]
MTELANSARVKRGFHRVGLALSILLGALTLVGGAMFSWDSANSQREQFLARRCIVNEMNKSSPGNKWTGEVVEIECHSTFPGWDSAKELEKLKQSVNSGFSYIATLASYLAVTALIASLVGLVAYFSVAAFSWIVRGFMRG